MLIAILLTTVLIFGVDIALIVLFKVNYKDTHDGISDTPFISILISARNEEKNIADCLDAILAIDYPADKFEVLVGNDNSDDQTGEISYAFSVRYPQIKSFNIYKQKIKGNGKANVLAQLIEKAEGDLIFITDADIEVPKTWVKSMLVGMSEDVALVTGTSLVVGSSSLAYMQQIDWLYATGMLKVVSDLDIAVTTMGNNMLFRKAAYTEIGGYEAMPFSITEDLELFNHIKQRYKTVNLFSQNVLNESKPERSLMALLRQRKRWMRGAFELPILMISLLIIQASFIFLVIGLLFLSPPLALVIFLIKFVLRYIFIRLSVKKLKNKVNIFGSLIFEVYTGVFSVVSLIYYFTSGAIEWKGRKY